uniref:Migration and invasion inhibitory protein n=1 Tax=Strix occidentalis caurina TaxID=311401 RepID=A0A8D0EUT4_STROC
GIRKTLLALFPLCKLEVGLRTVPSPSSQGLLAVSSAASCFLSCTFECPARCIRSLYELFSSQKQAGHVAFQSDPEECTIPVSSWAVRPFLGYDWIAGLLDTKSSVAEKSDQYFAELHEFRQANKEACIDEQNTMMVCYSVTGVYCYRLNQRLFTVPLDSESVCVMCKIPRTHQPPEILEEPAYVRVSVPRSTLMPSYKYKAHRRKSFELADDLALPSHCLAGWENTIPSSNPTLSSLDLRASLEEKPSHHPHLVRVPGGAVKCTDGNRDPLSLEGMIIIDG